MDYLVTWLRAQFDDDERVALRVLRFSRESYVRGNYETWVAERKVNNAEPPYYDYQQVRTERPGTVSEEIVRLALDVGGLTSDHLARFASPRRALAEVDAKRRRLALIAELATRDSETALRLAKLDALPYADRPGYRDEWAPKA